MRTVGRAAPAIAEAAALGTATRFLAGTRSASFYGGAGGGTGTLGVLGGRFGLGGVGAAAGGIFAAGVLKDLSQDLIEASAAFETFERTVAATEPTAEATAERWQALLDIANETVGIDVAGLVQYNSQLRVVGVEADRVDAVLRGVVKSVSELGRGVHVSREALNQLTDGIVRNHLNVRDWRAIVARIPQFLEAASVALGRTVNSLDDFKQGSEDANISISEGILRSLERLDETAVGLQGTYVAAVDRLNEATFKLKATLGEDLKDAVTPVISAIAASLNSLNDALSQTDEQKLAALFQRLEEVRDSRTIFGDNPLQREALRDIQRFLQENPDALPDTSPGALRALEAAQRAAQSREPFTPPPTAESIQFFQSANRGIGIEEEYRRRALSGALGGTPAGRLADLQRQLDDRELELFNLLNAREEEQTPDRQRAVEAKEKEIELLDLQIGVEKQLNQEQQRFQKAAEASIRAIADKTRAIEKATTAAADYERQLQSLGDAVIEGDIALRRSFQEDVARQGIGALATEQRTAEFRRIAEGVTAVETQRFIDRNAGYAGILSDGQSFPSLRELEQQSERRFRELGRAGPTIGRDLQGLVGGALQGGPEGIDTDALQQQYDEYIQSRIDGERRALRQAERYARQYERLWERTLGNVADVAIDAIFDRNISFGEALSGIAQNTLRDFANFYIREHIFGSGGGLGAGGAAGAGVALGGAGLLFPTEFQNLFEEIRGSFSQIGSSIRNFGIDRIFHSPTADLYADSAGAEIRRNFESGTPNAEQNAKDITDRLIDGFNRVDRQTGQSSTPDNLTIQIYIGENDDALISMATRFGELQEKGLIRLFA